MINIAFGLAFSLVTALVVILGDYLIKLAADGGMPITSRHVLIGSLLYAISAVIWFFALRHVTLAQAGVAYSMLTLLALAIIGATVFDEPIRTRETLGIGCALLSMVLMLRVA